MDTVHAMRPWICGGGRQRTNYHSETKCLNFTVSSNQGSYNSRSQTEMVAELASCHIYCKPLLFGGLPYMSCILEESVIGLPCEQLGCAAGGRHVSQTTLPVEAWEPTLQQQAAQLAGQEGAVGQHNELELLRVGDNPPAALVRSSVAESGFHPDKI